MTERFPTQATPDRPDFEVRVGGSAVEPLVQQDVVEIDVYEEVCKHGRLTLLVQNWDTDERRVRYSDDGPFAPGAAVEVSLGYHSELETVFSGVIASITTHFPSDDPPVMRIEARSKSIQLAHPFRSRVFEETTDGDVATAIAADYELSGDVATGAGLPFLVSDRRSDWDYLVKRAERLGWVTYVRGESLVFRPPAEPDQPIELQYGLNLAELHVTQDLSRLSEPVKTVAWDAGSLEVVEAEASASQAGVDGGERPDHASAVDDSKWPLREELVAAARLGTAEQRDLEAVGLARQIALGHFSGYGSTVGIPSMRCDSWISLQEIGERMSGPHYLSGVRHRLSARGYVTEFQLGFPQPLEPPATTQHSGVQIGVVDDLDDTDGWGRVKVAFPWRTDAPAAVWCRLATLDAGPDQGSFFLPDPGQEVVVGFFDGDDSQPVILGSLWNGNQAPPIAVDAEKNDLRAIVTRSGHKLTFDDGQGASIVIETAEGNQLSLSDADKAIAITEKESGNSITVSNKGIEITAAKGDIKLSASSGKVKFDASGIEGKSTGPAKLESSATLDLKASATLAIRGSLVNIN